MVEQEEKLFIRVRVLVEITFCVLVATTVVGNNATSGMDKLNISQLT